MAFACVIDLNTDKIGAKTKKPACRQAGVSLRK